MKGEGLEIELLQRAVGKTEPQTVSWRWAGGVMLHKAHTQEKRVGRKVACGGCCWRHGCVLGIYYKVQPNATLVVSLMLTLVFQYAHPMLTWALQLREFKNLLLPSLANHWGDLHMLLDAVPRFPSGIVNPLPLLHGQRELFKSFCDS